jgi:carboxymethylenebutenolidase
MSIQTIDVRTPDGVADAYLALPENGSRPPGVLFMMDAFGLRPRIEEMVARIAEHGFAVLAPNVFYRSARSPIVPPEALADAERRSTLFEQVRPMMAELTPERIVADGRVYLERLGEVAEAPFAITGYCMGGRLGWRIAAAFPAQVAALAGFHAGGLVTEDPDSPHLSAAEIEAELYFGHADNDHSMTSDQIAQLERALEDAGAEFRSELYEGAAHGYTMSDTPAYDEAAAERHFRELFALLSRTIER